MLQIEGGEETRQQPRAVIRFRYAFGPIPQTPIADQKIVTTCREIRLVDLRNPAGCEFRGSGVKTPVPARPVDRDTECGQAIDGGESEALGLSVVPSQAPKHAYVLRNLLLRV